MEGTYSTSDQEKTMCTNHAPTDGHAGGPSEEPAIEHCGHCSHEDPTLAELKGRRAQLDRDIAARELVHAHDDGLHHTA